MIWATKRGVSYKYIRTKGWVTNKWTKRRGTCLMIEKLAGVLKDQRGTYKCTTVANFPLPPTSHILAAPKATHTRPRSWVVSNTRPLLPPLLHPLPKAVTFEPPAPPSGTARRPVLTRERTQRAKSSTQLSSRLTRLPSTSRTRSSSTPAAHRTFMWF